MHLQPVPRPEHALRVSARLITASNILHLSADELDHAVDVEQLENPALEVLEARLCLLCGTPLYGPICPSCGRSVQSAVLANEQRTSYEVSPEAQWEEQQHYYQIPGSYDDSEDDEDFDLLANIPTGQTLVEVLLQQLEALVAPDDAPIAEQLVGNLNERGYLEVSTGEIAELLQVPQERVEYVLSQLQTLEPVGIGARNSRECLLIQLAAISEQEEPHPLAFTLIDRYLTQLGRGHFHEIARELKVPEQEIREASQYIRSRLYPFPAHAFRAETSFARAAADATYIRPDVIIRRGESGFEVELIEEKRYRFQVSAGYGTQPLYLDTQAASAEVSSYMRQHSERAKFFIDCVKRRWHTLKRVTELVVEYQQEFLEKGVRYLRPLTRAKIAEELNMDEGTVSRATANKYALLPNGRLIPMSDFFDGSLAVKDVLRELIKAEEPRHRLSDEELARLLSMRGISMARRTVTKYREEMGIGSSRER